MRGSDGQEVPENDIGDLSLDHLVGAGKERWRHGEAERSRRPTRFYRNARFRAQLPDPRTDPAG